MSKSKGMMIHARRRAMERYGFNVGEDSQNKIVKCIQEGNPNEVKFMEKMSNRVSAYKVLHREVWMNLLYDRQRKQIITFLPKVLRENEWSDVEY